MKALRLTQVDSWCIWVGVSQLLFPSLINVLINARSGLFLCLEELANPAPELAAGSSCASAEDHFVRSALITLDFHLTKRTNLALRLFVRGGHGGT